MPDNSNGITPPTHSFAGLPVCTRLEELAAGIAIMGFLYCLNKDLLAFEQPGWEKGAV